MSETPSPTLSPDDSNQSEPKSASPQKNTINPLHWAFIFLLVAFLAVLFRYVIFPLLQIQRSDVELIIIFVACIVVPSIPGIIFLLREKRFGWKTFLAIVLAALIVSVAGMLIAELTSKSEEPVVPSPSPTNEVQPSPLPSTQPTPSGDFNEEHPHVDDGPLKNPDDIKREEPPPDNDTKLSDGLFLIPPYFRNDHEKFYPLLSSDDISHVLLEALRFFDYIVDSNLLNGDIYPTYSKGNAQILVATNAIIPDNEKNYGKVVADINREYELLMEQYHLRPQKSNKMHTDAIETYGHMLKRQEDARAWSIEFADGVDFDLQSLIARNYKQRGDIYYKRGDLTDLISAINDYKQAIIEYAMLYRMCNNEGYPEKIDIYRIPYWVAAIYHNIGDILFENDYIHFRLGSYTTANTFFSASETLISNKRLVDYSIYYSAMARHKIYIEISKRATEHSKMPRELKHYLHEAYESYISIKDSIYLESAEKNYIRDTALQQVADACLAYLTDYPDEENGDIMQLRSYYGGK